MVAHPNFRSFISCIRQVMTNIAKRDQNVALTTDGVTQNENVKTLYNARKQFQESGTTSGKSIPARARIFRTKTIIFAT